MIQSDGQNHQIVFVNDNLAVDDERTAYKLFLTSGNVNILQIYGVREVVDEPDKISIFFRAAAPLAKDRNVFSITIKRNLLAESFANAQETGDFMPLNYNSGEWTCLSCSDDLSLPNRGPVEQCLYSSVSPAMSTWESDILLWTCSGPEVPFSMMLQLNDKNDGFAIAEVISENEQLIENLETVQLPTVQFNKFPSKTGFNFQYELWTPYNYDPNDFTIKHPLLVEIYSGPGSQAVTSSWSFGLSDKFTTSDCAGDECMNAIHIKIDTRGSGNAGDDLMHAVYKKLGWYEKVDMTEFVRALVLG